MSTSEKPEKPKPERERQDWLIVLLILLIGFCFVLGAGQYALRFAPNWQVNTDMGSNIDLNSEFLTSKPVDFFEPLDPAILTQPGWVNGNVFLTPGAGDSVVKNSTPLPTSGQDTPVPTVSGTIPVATVATLVTTSPTNTLVWIPVPATRTSKPGPVNTATNTSPAPAVTANLRIEKTSSTNWYAPGAPFSYTITVSNTQPGSNSVTNVTVSDTFPLQVASATGSCTTTGGATCGWSGPGNINDVVNLPAGSTITYNVNVTFNAGSSGTLTNNASVGGTGYTETNPADNVASLSADPGVDLVIAKVPGAGSYTPGNGFSYTITVTHNSTFALTGVNVTDTLSTLLTGVTWNCGPNPICSSSGSGNINDTINMPAGPGSVATYTISGTMHPNAWGTLENTAYVIAPTGFTETNTGNNSASTSTDRAGGSSLNIGLPDTSYITLGPPFPASMTMFIEPAIVADGTGNYDFVFYERLATADRVDFDWVEVWVSPDNSSWYQVFNWSDGSPDGNTTIAGLCPTEDDNCPIDRTDLYNNTGVAIDIDAIPGVSAGNYPWIMIVSPNSPGGDGSDIDAIQPYYP